MKKKLLNILGSAVTWNDLYIELKKCDAKNAGDLFELFCKLYYQLEPTIEKEYVNAWLFSEVPTHVKKKLNLGKIDHGIDIILEDRNGLYSAVQCKFRHDQNSGISWSKDKIANLFADGNKADYLIIFTNASHLDKHSISKNQDKLKIVTIGDLLNLSTETIMAMKDLILGKSTLSRPKKQPRKYQSAAITEVMKQFGRHDRGQLILPCGAGKTLTSLWLKEALAPKHVLVLFPSLALLRQVKSEWMANSSSFTPYISVCSESDINKDDDSSLTSVYEISGRVTTSPSVIQQFLMCNVETIVYATYQSLPAIQSAIKNSLFKFDLAICDEAHKTAGVGDSPFTLIHSDKNIPVKKRLYMTATPRVFSDKLKEDHFFLFDMSNAEIFGPEFYRMSFKKAIDEKILVDYQIVAVGITDKELEEAIHNRRYIDENTTLDEYAHNIALDKFMRSENASHAITFHSTVRRAQAFQVRHDILCSNVKCFHVNGDITTNDRNIILKEFEGLPSAVITNARCLTEGIDVPAIDLVYFCDPKNSIIDIVQATGRALRRNDSKDKKMGYVVVPIFHSDEKTLEKRIESGSFKNLVTIIRALCDHDERLVDEIKTIKLMLGQRKNHTSEVFIEISSQVIKFLGFSHSHLEKSIFCQAISKIQTPYKHFLQARDFAHSLKLSGKKAWAEYSKSGQRPPDIPAKPERIYKEKGWKGWGDWLGTGNKHPGDNNFLPFSEARSYVHGLGLKSQKEWQAYARSADKPDFLPVNPAQAYDKKGWVSWPDWLNSNSKHPGYKKCIPYLEAEKYARAQNLKKVKEWNLHWRKHKPSMLPAQPDVYYKGNGWVDWGTFLGTGIIASNILAKNKKPFEEARTFVHTLGLTSEKEWRLYCKSGNKPPDIPSNPRSAYKEKWISGYDWLGKGRKQEYLPYEEAKRVVRRYKLKNTTDWKKFCNSHKRPKNIPATPYTYYKNTGWVGWNDWLGTKNLRVKGQKFLPYKEAKIAISGFKIRSSRHWEKFCKSGMRPSNTPSNPAKYYKESGWVSWKDFLGYSNG